MASSSLTSRRWSSGKPGLAVPPEEAERRCRRALMEAWTGRESAAFRLPPSRLALDPADVITLAHDGFVVHPGCGSSRLPDNDARH
ncbi:phage tail protein [Candidatus Amarobacter glycogenicus]|uniref:phage tail protein n=1 Tax=Candidatus Amarobacter glycogenicus TaxID=3140699 RepID=UPI0031CC57B7